LSDVLAITYTPTPTSCFNSTTIYGPGTGTPVSDLAFLRSSNYNPVSYAKKIIVCGANSTFLGIQLTLGDATTT
jgi:hypothetical protein